MYGTGHRASGALAATTAAWLLHLDAATGAAVIAGAVAGSAGVLSPDIDQRWKLPGKLAHRRGTHYWRWLAAAGTVLLSAATAGWLLLWTIPDTDLTDAALPLMPALLAWTVGLVAGWFVHLAGDWAFGRRVYGTDGAGIPTKSPTSGYRGLGWFRAGGRVEWVFTALVLVPGTVWTGALWLSTMAGS